MYSLRFFSFLDPFFVSSFSLLFHGIQGQVGSQNTRIHELNLLCEYEDPMMDPKGVIDQKRKWLKNEKNRDV